MRVYLDHNASSPMRPEVKEAVLASFDVYGNPSSVHKEGQAAKGLISVARQQVGRLLGADPRSVVFNSGATEGANHIIRSDWDDVLYLATEHDCVRAPSMHVGGMELPVDKDGIVNLTALAGALETLKIEADGAVRRNLVCVQMANNETGVLQPIDKISEITCEFGAYLLVDAVQAYGKVPVDFGALGADFLLVSSHKIAGPKGAGAVVMRDGLPLVPLLQGGGQELRFRAGTENVPAIAGFGAAAEVAIQTIDQMDALAALRDQMEEQLLNLCSGRVVLGEAVSRLPNTSAFCLPGHAAETVVIGLDLAGVSVSSGSACSSGKVGQSHVLEAMGYAPDLGRSVLRISLGWNNSKNDIDALVDALRALISKPKR